MKALVQRVRYARVTINGEQTREIGPGMLVLFGCAATDDLSLCDKLADKTANLRIFEDEAGKMNLSALDLGYSAMVVSQFTLLADTKKGNRPSFTGAAKPPLATEAYARFLSLMRQKGFKDVQSGEFGADMQIEFCNDGPVTVMLDTEEWKR
ncbi:MAG: D-tyrosyl-tRNA(Tyr) deacylase [Oscillospiraceae bacterium]|nr:D-tyrosyl-tRNA(Tyr) deacylase [Oscillospiraceae bacterium]